MKHVVSVALLVIVVVWAKAQEPTDAEPFFPGLAHDAAITTPDELLGFRLGARPAWHDEIERCFQTWSRQSPRVALFSHGRTVEGRALFHAVISSPANVSRIDQIKADLARLADPRGLSDQQANVLLARTPAVAWLAYSIHGDELSGADAALAAGWHYASCTDPKVQALLDEVIIIIDPVMNPDGRDRYLAQLREMRSSVPTTDDQSRLHGGRWPYGRTNHYLFDMNRDWIFGICPETRGRIQAASAWHPMLFVDAHEMGPQDTYLFSPSREPINGNYPKFLHKWLDIFAGDQSAAFDRRGWRYYTGEWADDWYPGYSNAWASFRGAIGILYEQAGVDWYGVKRPEGRILTYRESVHHQLLSTLVNVETLHAHRDEIKQGWFETRRACVAPDGPYANRTFAIVPNANVTRLEAFANMMRLQGFEMFELTEPFSVPATDRLGRRYDALSLPAGTVLVPNAQPNAHLLAAMLEFDPRMSDAFLEKERRELIRRGDTELYDITGWSLPMLLDLDAYELHTPLPETVTRPFTGPVRPRGGVDHRNPGQGWVIDGTDDQTPAVAMRLMRAGVRVRFADEPFTWGTRSYVRGSLVVAREDQQREDDSWIDALDRITRDAGLLAEPIETGLGAGVIADIGGEHFDLLTTPRIAVLTESPVNSYDFGSIWHTLDERFKLPASYIPAERLSWTDLRRYNVLIAPEGAGDLLEEAGPSLARWIESGGTLIAIGSSARAIARDEGLSSVRLLRDVLDELDDYEIAVLREFASHADSLDAEQLWSYRVGNSSPAFPWDGVDFDRESVEQLERRDAWQRQFMPPGTIVAARVDDEHWLTAGCGDELPILFGSSAVLMAMDSVEVPLRFGVLEDDAESTEPRRIGWCTIPAGRDLRLRMSGLLWPEAAHRIANGAAVTREPVGSGQIILFADPPTFRAASLGTMRVFMNAVIYGPGLGASQPIMP